MLVCKKSFYQHTDEVGIEKEDIFGKLNPLSWLLIDIAVLVWLAIYTAIYWILFIVEFGHFWTSSPSF